MRSSSRRRRVGRQPVGVARDLASVGHVQVGALIDRLEGVQHAVVAGAEYPENPGEHRGQPVRRRACGPVPATISPSAPSAGSTPSSTPRRGCSGAGDGRTATVDGEWSTQSHEDERTEVRHDARTAHGPGALPASSSRKSRASSTAAVSEGRPRYASGRALSCAPSLRSPGRAHRGLRCHTRPVGSNVCSESWRQQR